MYSEVGKFKPGDKIKGKINPINYRWSATTGITIIKTKKRAKRNLYTIQCKDPDGIIHTNSYDVHYIDRNYEFSLKHTLKNL